VSVVLPVEVNFAVLHLHQALIGDGHPVRVAGQVLENLLRTAERRISILPIITLPRQKRSPSAIPIIPSLARLFSCAGPRRLPVFAIFGS
jgi:hypothetical protein